MKHHKSLFPLLLIISYNVLSQQQNQVSMFRGNAQLTGVLENVQAIHRLSGVKFNFLTGGAIRSTPAVVAGNVYFGSSDGQFYCLDGTSGREKWKFQTGGAVNSSPAINNGKVYFTSRDNYLYALHMSNGKLIWKFKMNVNLPYENGFDYFLSSPNITNDTLFVGSGDGNLYAINSKSGTVHWKYFANSRIRTTPAIINNFVVFGTLSGIIYAVDRTSGSLLWKFETKGSSLKFEEAGYDQTSIIGSPVVNQKGVYVGGRDGYLYAINLITGKEMWKVSHRSSWVLATGVDEESVYAVSGSSAFIQALDINGGKELWRYKTSGAVYSSPLIVQDVLYCADNGGNLFALDKKTGIKIWSFPMGGRVFSSPVVANNMVYCGADNGNLFALEGTSEPTIRTNARKVVYWDTKLSEKEFNWYSEGSSITIRDYFKNAGYEVMNGKQLNQMMLQQVETKTSSVVVFAKNKFPKEIINDSTENAIIRKYLDAGGKVVITGPNPLGFLTRDTTGELHKVDFVTYPEKILGLKIYDRAYINWGSVYRSSPTKEGYQLGLRGWWISASSVLPADVSVVLATNEHGFASSWLKNYGGPKGTGFLQLCIPGGGGNQELVSEFLSVVRAAIEYGIDW